MPVDQEQPEMATDLLDEIQKVIDYLREELKQERISYGELNDIQSLYDIAKGYL